MAEFFLSTEALERLAENDQGKKILSSQNQIYLDVDRDSLDSLLEKEESTIFEFQSGSDVRIVDAKNDINEMKRDRSLFYRHPFGIFVLDVPPTEAKKIQKETGVLCMSDQDLPNILKAETILWDGLTFRRSIQCKKDSLKHNWEEFLTRIKKIPSNSIVINDRYLFAEDKDALSLGAINIANLLNQIMPKKLIFGEYHVLIIYDKTKTPNLDIEGISSEILGNIKRKQLDIKLEIVGGSNLSTIFKNFTHNRLIATNYGIFVADHLFAAFDNELRARADQSIVYKGLFSEGLTEDYDDSVFPIEAQSLFLDRIKELIVDAGTYERLFLFWVKNKKIENVSGAQAIENRLIRYH